MAGLKPGQGDACEMKRLLLIRAVTGIALLGPALYAPASAQEAKEPRRIRVGLGAQIVPSFPGAEDTDIRPFVDLALSRGDRPFAFEAPDESFGFSLINSGGLQIGPVLNIEGSRTPEDIGAPLDKVSTIVELGGFAQYQLSPSFRVRTEARRGVGGHEGWTTVTGADYILRDKDRYLFSIGPRLTISDSRYQRAYFGVTSAEAARSGLPAYRPDAGVQAIGGTVSFLTQVAGPWGLSSYARYDRLVGDAARSPVVRALGSRDQISAGLALTYTFFTR